MRGSGGGGARYTYVELWQRQFNCGTESDLEVEQAERNSKKCRERWQRRGEWMRKIKVERYGGAERNRYNWMGGRKAEHESDHRETEGESFHCILGKNRNSLPYLNLPHLAVKREETRSRQLPRLYSLTFFAPELNSILRPHEPPPHRHPAPPPPPPSSSPSPHYEAAGSLKFRSKCKSEDDAAGLAD
ncbi:Hypothetical protein NTJ_02808 [Nesidiocoris tenuis]|uniref:Uncharacterized protein n=1 Tax=Nesidiocoris tenuis TaxID=355587 RepID=A0ABN7AGK2_9HEMI|nr:Hypothetical protein NTJ_02808 [Nesidiocoris tenuis]